MTFHYDIFRESGLETHFAEEYYSMSHKGVLRGLHFQLPPAGSCKNGLLRCRPSVRRCGRFEGRLPVFR